MLAVRLHALFLQSSNAVGGAQFIQLFASVDFDQLISVVSALRAQFLYSRDSAAEHRYIDISGCYRKSLAPR